MKWIETIAIAIILAISVPVFAEQKGPWGFENISVITLPTNAATVRRTIDMRAVELLFSKWNAPIEKAIKESLAESPLQYRLHPSRQTTMIVEIFSMAATVDFALRAHKRQTQVIIGELRQERHVSKLLGAGVKKVRLGDDVIKLVREGKLVAARQAIVNLPQNKISLRFLARARIASLNRLRFGVTAARCPRPPTRLELPAVQEGAILCAWCLREAGKYEDAMDYLRVLEKVESLSEDVKKRKKEIETLVIAGRILSADRNGDHLYAAAYAVEYHELLKQFVIDTSFIEAVSENLNKVGVGGFLASTIQEVMARPDTGQMLELAPTLVEAYLAAGKYIPAMDASEYFLTKRLPNWFAGRLRRVLGLARLQEGDWRGAVSALSFAKKELVGFSIDDSLALAEASLRSGMPAGEVEKELRSALSGRARRLSPVRQKWVRRISGEIILRMGQLPPQKTLEEIPDFVLFEVAELAEEQGDLERREKLLKQITKGRGGWRDLAKLVQETDVLELQFKEMRAAIEEMR